MPKLSLLLGLSLLGGAAPLLVLPSVAHAQPAPVFAGSGFLELLPATDVVGDGTSASDLYILALDPAGAPIGGLSLKASATGGTVGALVDAGGGLYRIPFTAAKVGAKGTAAITLKGKIGKDTVQKTWNVAVSPPRSTTLTAAANPPKMTLGQDRTATISFNLAGGDRQSLTGVDLVVQASSGTVENVTNLGGGQFSALYTAPSVNYPHVAILTFADKRDPSHAVGSLAIPLWGKVEFPVVVAPDARAILKIGQQQFGPIQADKQGRARVPVLVEPGAQLAEKISIGTDGKSVTEPLDLKVPEARRLSLFPTAAALPGDARAQIPVYAAVVMPDGKPDTAAQVAFSTTGGTITAATHVGNGVYKATLTPPTGASAAQATITAELSDRPAVQTAVMDVNFVSVRPARVELTAEPATLSSSAEGFKVFAKVTGPDGMGLGARTLSFTASGARLKEVKDLRNGDYQGLFTTSEKVAADVAVSVAAPVTGNPLSRVLVVPARTRVDNDGNSSVAVTVVTVDEFGYPVPNVAVALKLESGDGTLPQSATTNADGMATVFYAAGRSADLVRIAANAGELQGFSGLLQVPAALALGDLPASGAKESTALIGEWKATLPSLHVNREGAVAAATVAPVAAPTVGAARATRAALTSDPATVSAGGTVKLKVNLTDEAGRGVGGQKLDFLVSSGTVGTVTDLGGGQYEASFTVPTGTTGDVKVSVATQDGTASSFMRVPVGGADSMWLTASPFTTTESTDPYATPAAKPAPAPAPAPKPAPAPAPPPAPKPTPAQPAGEHPWLRVRGGFEMAWYDYDQLPLAKETVLFPKELKVSSLSYGGHVQGRAFLPMFKYVGLEADFRGTTYSLNPVPLCAALESECPNEPLVSDTVLATRVVGIGRYAWDSGANQFGVGGRVGWGVSDVQIFTVKGGQEITLDQIYINSLAVGAEFTADVGKSLFFVGSFTEHLAGGGAPYNTEAQLEVGYAFLPFLYGSLSYDLSMRAIEIENRDGNKVGQITDSLHGGALSLGLQL